MKVKIIKYVPVNDNYRPKEGEIYEAVELDNKGRHTLKYEIEVNGEKVRLYDHEAEKVND